MIIVIADTSGLLAALDSTHPEQEAANEAIQSAGLLIMSPLLLAELDHVATCELGRVAALSAVDDIRHWMRRVASLSPRSRKTTWAPRSPSESATARWTSTSPTR